MKTKINCTQWLQLAALFLLTACNNLIKNSQAQVAVEAGTEVKETPTPENTNTNPLIGLYVGDFVPDIKDSEIYKKDVYAGEAFHWGRENKIAVSIQTITDNTFTGESIVAGNQRPFKGSILNRTERYNFVAKEPGDDQHDGTFNFDINDTVMDGYWEAYAKADIKKRTFHLIKKTFQYNAHQFLDSVIGEFNYVRFIDWNKPKFSEKEEAKLKAKMTKEEREEYENFRENTDFTSATDKIFKVNASNTLLKEADVANWFQGDLYIIRNTIYARHGFSFKNRPLRVLFDKQPWYIPVTTNIQNSFTEIEKKNIALLLKYEKNAKAYYDYFGRG